MAIMPEGTTHRNNHAEPALACPTWCISTHTEDTTLHVAEDISTVTIHGKHIEVSRYDDNGRHGVYVGNYEFGLDEARALIAALTVAVSLPAGPVLAVTR